MNVIEKVKKIAQDAIDSEDSGDYEKALYTIANIEAEKLSEDALRVAVEIVSHAWDWGIDEEDVAKIIQSFSDSQLSKELDRAEGLTEFARSIVEWSEAYAAKTFGEPEPAKVAEVCEQLGTNIQTIATMVLRNYTKPYGDMARRVLAKYQEEGE
jgi:hypothetical protein